MELTGKLKGNVAKAKTKAEAKDIIGRAGMLLTDDELDKVAGGGFQVVDGEGNVISDGEWVGGGNGGSGGGVSGYGSSEDGCLPPFF